MSIDQEPTQNSKSESIVQLALDEGLEALKKDNKWKLIFFIGEDMYGFHIAQDVDKTYKAMFTKGGRNLAIRSTITPSIEPDQLDAQITRMLSDDFLESTFTEIELIQLKAAIKQALNSQATKKKVEGAVE